MLPGRGIFGEGALFFVLEDCPPPETVPARQPIGSDPKASNKMNGFPRRYAADQLHSSHAADAFGFPQYYLE
jgi:hypothetical protein